VRIEVTKYVFNMYKRHNTKCQSNTRDRIPSTANSRGRLGYTRSSLGGYTRASSSSSLSASSRVMSSRDNDFEGAYLSSSTFLSLASFPCLDICGWPWLWLWQASEQMY